MYNKIYIKDLTIYGKHGVYDEEKKLDAPFLLNISCTINSIKKIEDISQTINYENIFQIAKKVFETSYDLLESLAYDIAIAIKSNYSIVDKVYIDIRKLNPSIAQLQGKVGISLEL